MKNILFICKANVGRSQIAQGIYNSLSFQNKAISCAGIQAVKTKYFGKPDPLIIEIVGKNGIDISHQKIHYLGDFSSEIPKNIKIVVFLYDPKVQTNIDAQCLKNGFNAYTYFLQTDTEIIIHEIPDLYGKNIRETQSIFEQIKTFVETKLENF